MQQCISSSLLGIVFKAYNKNFSTRIYEHYFNWHNDDCSVNNSIFALNYLASLQRTVIARTVLE